METIITTDTFDAFVTDDGIEIKEKKGGAKKVGIIVSVMGLIFLAISFIPMEGVTAKWITTLFTSVFFYGGLVLLPLGIITFVLRGMSGEDKVSKFNSNTKELTIHGKKVIPFSEIDEIIVQTSNVMGKSVTAFIMKHNGRKKPFIHGTVISNDVTSLQSFADRVKELVEG